MLKNTPDSRVTEQAQEKLREAAKSLIGDGEKLYVHTLDATGGWHDTEELAAELDRILRYSELLQQRDELVEALKSLIEAARYAGPILPELCPTQMQLESARKMAESALRQVNKGGTI